MKRLLCLPLLLLFLAAPALAQERHPLTGFFVGPEMGHMQTSSTVTFQGKGQINDVSGNTILPGIVLGWSHATANGLFFGVDIHGAWPPEPYRSTIVQYAGREYLVERSWEVAVLGRLGYAFGRYGVVYGAAGVAAASVTYSIDGDRSPRVLWRPQLGVGLEFAVTDNVAIRGDWRFDWVKQDLGPVQAEYEFRTLASAAVVWRF